MARAAFFCGFAGIKAEKIGKVQIVDIFGAGQRRQAAESA